MKRLFFLPLLFIGLVLYSQKGGNGKRFKPNPFHQDSIAAKIQRMNDSMQKTLNDIEWERNRKNLEDLTKTIQKRDKKEKTKAILYIGFGVGMLLLLLFGLMRKRRIKSN